MKKNSFTLILFAFFLCIITTPSNSKSYKYDDGIEEITKQIEKTLDKKKLSGIAILDFPEISGKQILLSKHLSEKLIYHLFKIKGLKVIERNQLNKIINELKLQNTGLIDSDTIKKLGKILGVDALVIGTITLMGKKVEVNGRIVSAETAEILAVTSVSFIKDDSIAELVDTDKGSDIKDEKTKGKDKTVPKKRLKWSFIHNNNPCYYIKVDNTTWDEYQNGKITASFIEKQETKDYVLLYDAGRDLFVKISQNKLFIQWEQGWKHNRWVFWAEGHWEEK